jgi:hypothetical protein
MGAQVVAAVEQYEAEHSRPAQHSSPVRREEAPSGPLLTPDAAQVEAAVEQLNCSLPSPQQYDGPVHAAQHPNCGAAAGSHPCIKAG